MKKSITTIAVHTEYSLYQNNDDCSEEFHSLNFQQIRRKGDLSNRHKDF